MWRSWQEFPSCARKSPPLVLRLDRLGLVIRINLSGSSVTCQVHQMSSERQAESTSCFQGSPGSHWPFKEGNGMCLDRSMWLPCRENTVWVWVGRDSGIKTCTAGDDRSISTWQVSLQTRVALKSKVRPCCWDDDCVGLAKTLWILNSIIIRNESCRSFCWCCRLYLLASRFRVLLMDWGLKVRLTHMPSLLQHLLGGWLDSCCLFVCLSVFLSLCLYLCCLSLCLSFPLCLSPPLFS